MNVTGVSAQMCHSQTLRFREAAPAAQIEIADAEIGCGTATVGVRLFW